MKHNCTHVPIPIPKECEKKYDKKKEEAFKYVEDKVEEVVIKVCKTINKIF